MPAAPLPLTETLFDETQPLDAAPDAVLERARIMLGTRGFAVTVQGRRLLAQGPHLLSASQQPVLGAGRIVLDVDDAEARLASDLSGLSRLRWFVMFGPTLIAVAIGGGMTLAGVDGALRPALINALIWLFLGPALSVWLRRRTERALVTLLHTLRKR
ncbi:MAG: hypothetical protein VX265_17785 [Myxococcota bacterium]|nr:hypothetical protein [Myxococcota bacterium]